MPRSPLTDYTLISPNRYNGRAYPVTKITPHHMAGVLTVEQCGSVFQNPSRQASSNYGIGPDGRIGCYVDEADAAWTSSDWDNDNRAVTIEVANSEAGGDWPVSGAAWDSLVELCADICRRNGIPELVYTGDASGNLTEHRMFAPTGCPGPYLHARMSELARQVNAKLRGEDDDMKLEELMNHELPTGDNNKKYPFWQLSSWAYTYAKQAVEKLASLTAYAKEEKTTLAAMSKKLDKVAAGNVDVDALADAVADKLAKRLES